MSTGIKKIDIKAFRGIPELEINLNGKGLILKGDNGTGKSSIVDAIEFFFLGRVNHLEGVQGISLQRHAPHISYKPDDVKVTLTLDPGGIVLERTFKRQPEYPKQLAEYFAVTQTGVYILRRAQVLEFIISQPAERFRTIGSIIGIEELDNIELAMMRARDKLETDSNATYELIQYYNQQLSNILGKDVSSAVEIFQALNDILKNAGLPLIKSLDDAEKHAEKMLSKVKGEDAVQKVARLEELCLDLKSIVIDKVNLIKATNVVNEKIKGLLDEQNKKERAVVSLLEIGVKVMVTWQMDICPLCQQPIAKMEILGEIKRRLGVVKALSDKASEIRRECLVIKNKLEEILKVLTRIVPKNKEFPVLGEYNEMFAKQIASINQLLKVIDSASETQNIIPLDILAGILIDTKDMLGSACKKSDELVGGERLTSAEKEVLRIVGIIGQIKNIFGELSKKNGELKSIKRQLGIAKNIFSSFTSIKRRRVQDIFNVIQGDIERYYSILHPGDAHRNIELKIPSSRRASVELRIESFGKKDEDPRAYSSEGHLDSLGLCIFLAFVKKFNQDCSLVVLDDVVTTVDVGHRENICELLIEEFSDKQLIVTTHENLWYEQLRNHHRAAKVEGKFNYISAVKWDVNSGPTIRPYKPRWERIVERLENGDKSVGTEGRIYMEWVLEAICNSLEAQVIFRNSREWNIGELYSSAKTRAERLINNDEYKEKVLKAFTRLESTAIYGNIVSHNNPMAEELSITEIGNFCNAVNDLYIIFLCPNCGNLMKYVRESKRIRCCTPKCNKQFEVKTL